MVCCCFRTFYNSIPQFNTNQLEIKHCSSVHRSLVVEGSKRAGMGSVAGAGMWVGKDKGLVRK